VLVERGEAPRDDHLHEHRGHQPSHQQHGQDDHQRQRGSHDDQRRDRLADDAGTQRLEPLHDPGHRRPLRQGLAHRLDRRRPEIPADGADDATGQQQRQQRPQDDARVQAADGRTPEGVEDVLHLRPGRRAPARTTLPTFIAGADRPRRW